MHVTLASQRRLEAARDARDGSEGFRTGARGWEARLGPCGLAVGLGLCAEGLKGERLPACNIGAATPHSAMQSRR